MAVLPRRHRRRRRWASRAARRDSRGRDLPRRRGRRLHRHRPGRAVWRRRTGSSRRCHRARSCRLRRAAARRSGRENLSGEVWATDGFAGLFAADSEREADLRGGAEEVGDLVEGALQRGEEIRLEEHVVVEQADVRVAGAGDAAVDGAGEGERGGGVDDFDLGVSVGEPGGGVVRAAVIDDDDLVGGLREKAG